MKKIFILAFLLFCTIVKIRAQNCNASITASGPTTFCSGGIVTLSTAIVPGYTYQWLLNGAAISSATNYSYNVTTDGSYTVRVTASGCQATSSPMVVTVYPTPGAYISASSPTSFCTGESVILNATTGSGYTYQWNLNGTAISGATNSSYTASASGSYTVTILTSNCQATSGGGNVTATYLTPAIITPVGSTSFPSGGSVVLNANTGTGYTYQWFKGGLPISGATSSSYTASASGNYTVNVKLSGCTKTSSPVAVSVSAASTLVATFLPVKVFLQGAYSTSLLRHKNVTSTWAAVLNANALTQPYSAAPFSYPGTESVNAGFFKSTGSGTDILDWVLLELRDPVTPATVKARQAAFIRADGRIVDRGGTSDVSFTNLPNGNYHLVIRHRNHLAIRTATARTLDASITPVLYDFTTAQSKAFKDVSITKNEAMKEVSTGVFGMWGGNANGMTSTTDAATAVRVNGPGIINDYFFLFNTTLGGSLTTIISNVYHPADVNMDGAIRANGPAAINDYIFLFNTVLGGDITKVINQHQ